MKVRKKPVVVDAVQFKGLVSIPEIIEFCPAFELLSPDDSTVQVFGIKTLEGTMEASPGDWIIKGVKGEFYPCKPDIFEATYEPVTE